MNNAQLYKKANWCQRRDADEILNEYRSKINWKLENDRTIDIGCGDGGVTVDIIKKYLPENYKTLVGCDINEDMVRLASEQSSDRTEFMLLDIAGDMPDHLLNSFDHAFSFYALNWVKDQKKVYKNIYNLLSDGGDCVLMLVGHHVVYSMNREMAKNERWKKLMGDIEPSVSPYHDSQNPEKEIKDMMTSLGYKNISVEKKRRTHIFESYEHLKMAITAVNPYTIPEEYYDSFMEDYMSLYSSVNYKDEPVENRLPSFKDYNYIVIYGSK